MKKNKILVGFLILTILIGVYFAGSFYYKDKLPMNTYVNQANLGGMTLENADIALEKSDAWDKITIKSNSEDFLEVKSDQIDYKYISSPNLDKIFDEQSEWKWFFSIFQKSEYTTPIIFDYNENKLKDLIASIEELDKELLNAQAVYSSSSNAFIIEPHSYEIQITEKEIANLVAEAMENKELEVNIEEYIKQPDIFEDDEKLNLAKDKANELLDLRLVYDFADREEVIDQSILKDLIFVKDREVEIDPEKTNEFVISLARKYDTFSSNRNFITSSGESIVTNGGSYGWLVHRKKTTDELMEHIKTGENKTIEPVYSYKALIRNSDDVGNSYVEIDLNRQMVYLYIDGQLKVQTPTVTGNTARGHDTPTGVFPLNYKEKDAVLRGENYASPVKYWMPFNGNVGMHDADWRNSFGGDIYRKNGSNGCINLPPSDAKTIFDLVYPGMPVIVH